MIKINVKRGLTRVGIICTIIIIVSVVGIAISDPKNWLEPIGIGIGLVLAGWICLFTGFWIADGFKGNND